jgi:hypothetical protein
VETPVAEGILRTVRTVATVVILLTQGIQNRDFSHSRKSRYIDSCKNNSKRIAESSTRDNWNIQDARTGGNTIYRRELPTAGMQAT